MKAHAQFGEDHISALKYFLAFCWNSNSSNFNGTLKILPTVSSVGHEEIDQAHKICYKYGCESCWFFCFNVFTAIEQPFFLFRYYPHTFAHTTPQSQPQIAVKKTHQQQQQRCHLHFGLEAFQCLKLQAGCGSRKQIVKMHQYAIMLKGSDARFLRSPELKQMRIQSPILIQVEDGTYQQIQ